MTKVIKISNIDPQRLTSLENRYNRLVQANKNHHYIYSDKDDRYFECLLYIKLEMSKRRVENRRANENQSWRKALLATSGMNGAEALLSLTKIDSHNLTIPTL